MSIIKSPVSMCIIVRNDPFLEQCILSFKDYVEEIIVIDTGSDDGITKEIGKKYATYFEEYSGCNDPETGKIEDFSNARNYSFSKATQPWVSWCDSDDIIQFKSPDTLLNLINNAPKDQDNLVVFYAFPYLYSFDQNGEPTCKHYRERLFLNKNKFSWINSVHEVCCPNDGLATNFTTFDDIVYKHKRQYSNKPQEPGRNLRIIKKYLEKIGPDHKNYVRQLYYAGLEYKNSGQFGEAIEHLTKYIGLSGWPDERVMACISLWEIYMSLSDLDTSIKWAFKAIEIKEDWCEGYLCLTKTFYQLASKGDINEMDYWRKCVHFAKIGLALPPTQTLLFINPIDRESEIYKYVNVAQNKLGDVKSALDSVNTGLIKQPNDAGLLHNKKLYSEFLIRQEIMNASSKLKDIGAIDNSNLEMINAIINNQEIKLQNNNQEATSKIKETSVAIQKVEESIQQMTHNKLEAIFEEGNPFPIANVSDAGNIWSIPNASDFNSMPIKMSDDQLQAVVIMVWKQFMLHDEVLSAISFLENAPINVKHSFITEKALRLTKDCLVWMDNKDDFQAVNAPANPEVEAGNPLPNKLIMAEGHRFDLIANHLEPNSTLVDFGSMDGCFVNRYGLLGHKGVGLDVCESSVKLANKKAAEFNTGAKFVCTYFQDAVGKVESNYFQYATSSDTYEHLKDPVNDMLIPAYKMLKDDGKFLLATPYGAWMRGNYLEWAHPWVWSREGKSWLQPSPRAHLIAPSAWSVAEHFRKAGYWVKDSYPDLCNSAFADVKGQGNIFAEAWKKAPAGYEKGLDVVLFIGNGVEEWNPKTVKQTGIGGSELMAIEMSKRLAGLGHKVRVYNSCGEHGEGIYDGVEYRKSEKYQDLECDVLIVSRNASAVDDNFNVKAKLKLLWVHDLYISAYTNERALKFDRILALSNFHKNLLVNAHNLHSDHLITTRNGISLSRFENKNIKRDRFKCVNSSSPDRSWPILLSIWPKIKEQVPEATLTLAYGWKNWEYSAQWDKLQQDLIQRLKDQIEVMKPLGVNFIGRVSQEQLAEEMLSSGVSLHPTWFAETSGITFMENQAAGLRIVSSAIGALNETVNDRGYLIKNKEWTSQEYEKEFIEATIKALNNYNEQDRIELQNYAKEHFCLDKLTKNWNQMFYLLLKENNINPIIPYSPTVKYK